MNRLAILVLTLLQASSALAADALLERPETLRGAHASWEVTFEGSGSPRVDLRYEASDLLSRRSLLTVEVDGVPRVTRPLRASGRLVAALGELGEGFHRLTVRARLRVDEDPCLDQSADDAWVRIDSADLHGVSASAGGETLLEWLAEQSEESIRLEVPDEVRESLEPDWASAVLDAHALLWSRGLKPAPRADRALHLRVGAVDEGVAFAAVDGDDLVVTAAGPGALAVGLRALGDEGVLQRCATEGCELSELRESAEVRSDRTTEVVRLDDLGFARGWRAAGEGRHVLRFGWDRPADWRPTEWPRVEMAVRVPATGIDVERSRATLSVNDIPLATWALEAGEARWRGRVPEAVWTEGRWEVELAVTLRTHEDEGCHDEDDDLWVHVDGSSSLTVPREELAFAGLASAVDHFRGAPLVWNERLGVDALGAVGAVLAPLQGSEPWRWLPPGRECRGACIRIASGRWWEDESRLTLVGDVGRRRWRDDSGELGMPLLPAEDTLLLERRGRDELLVVALGAPEELAPPSWVGLLGEIALFHDGAWDILAVDDEPTVARVVEAPEPEQAAQMSVEEAQVRWVDVGFTVLAGLVLASVAFTTFRRRRRKDTPSGVST